MNTMLGTRLTYTPASSQTLAVFAPSYGLRTVRASNAFAPVAR
jgi:hypothetical protein